MNGSRERRRPPPIGPNAWLRFDLIRRRLAADPPGTCIELGPGLGAFGARLALASDRYVGIEPSDESRAVAQRRIESMPGSTAEVVSSLDEVDPGSGFDLVCAFEVLEHLEDDLGMLRSWVRLARPGGSVMVSVPAFEDRFGPYDELVGHYRRYELADLRRLGEQAGLVEIEVEAYGYPVSAWSEGIRHRLAARKLAGSDMGAATQEQRTEASGRWWQPTGAGALFEYATAPARWFQRRYPDRGTGAVLFGRRPAGDPTSASPDGVDVGAP